LCGIVGFDLLTGVIAGIVASAIKLLYTFSHLHVEIEEFPSEGRAVVHLNGAATFIRLPRLARALEKVAGNPELHVRMEKLSYIDHACLELLENWRERHANGGGEVVLDWETLHDRFKAPIKRFAANRPELAAPEVASGSLAGPSVAGVV
jgi:MFS superfamily sulfate permease-like transporter